MDTGTEQQDAEKTRKEKGPVLFSTLSILLWPPYPSDYRGNLVSTLNLFNEIFAPVDNPSIHLSLHRGLFLKHAFYKLPVSQSQIRLVLRPSLVYRMPVGYPVVFPKRIYAVTAPLIILRIFDNAGPHRIQLNVTPAGKHIFVP